MSNKDYLDTIYNALENDNSDTTLNYNPEMVYNNETHQMQPMQPQMQPQMQPIQPQMQPPMQTMQQMQPMQPMQPQMQQPMEQMQSMQSDDNEQQGGYNNINDEQIDGVDIGTYGMDDDTDKSSILNIIINEIKIPVMGFILYFIFSIPQISNPLKNFLYGYLTNSLYVNIIFALLFGILFYVGSKFLF